MINWNFFCLFQQNNPITLFLGQKKFTYLTVSSKYLENHANFHFGTILRKSPSLSTIFRRTRKPAPNFQNMTHFQKIITIEQKSLAV